MKEQHPVGRVRIRTHEYMSHTHEGSVVMRTETIPSLPDISVAVVNPDGTETPIQGVTSVTWRAQQGKEPCSATIEVVGAEVQAHAKGVLEFVPLNDGEIPSHLKDAIARSGPKLEPLDIVEDRSAAQMAEDGDHYDHGCEHPHWGLCDCLDMTTHELRTENARLRSQLAQRTDYPTFEIGQHIHVNDRGCRAQVKRGPCYVVQLSGGYTLSTEDATNLRALDGACSAKAKAEP